MEKKKLIFRVLLSPTFKGYLVRFLTQTETGSKPGRDRKYKKGEWAKMVMEVHERCCEMERKGYTCEIIDMMRRRKHDWSQS